jgi:hypothetical protein
VSNAINGYLDRHPDVNTSLPPWVVNALKAL